MLARDGRVLREQGNARWPRRPAAFLERNFPFRAFRVMKPEWP